MKTIWKFPMPPGCSAVMLRMPKGAEVLTVQQQGETHCVWALVDPNAAQENRYFELHGTGNPMPEIMGGERKYIGTFQQPPFVWHVFERA